ncbi:MAG: hypothetical protein WDM71_07535 [Ferruginibacter sp.]
MKKIYLIIVCSIICLAGCKNKDGVPSGILEREKMQAVLWDIMRADIFANQSIKKDSSKNVAVENAKLQLLILIRIMLPKKNSTTATSIIKHIRI